MLLLQLCVMDASQTCVALFANLGYNSTTLKLAHVFFTPLLILLIAIIFAYEANKW